MFMLFPNTCTTNPHTLTASFPTGFLMCHVAVIGFSFWLHLHLSHLSSPHRLCIHTCIVQGLHIHTITSRWCHGTSFPTTFSLPVSVGYLIRLKQAFKPIVI